MKILKCHIENFGNLSNFDYEFKDGLNTIKENNGFGKTTFANFIKAMFYGLESKKNTKTLVERKKYEPWQGGNFGGNIEFEIDGKKYKIERFFGKKDSEDTFKLYDLSTNLESTDYSTNIGEEVFKLNKEAYERSTFISGQNMETSMNDSINAKLGNLLESENDINTSEQAIKALEDAIRNYKKTGDRGEINQKVKEKTKLEQKIEERKVDEKALQERREQNSDLNKQIEEKELEQKNLQKTLTDVMELEAKRIKEENYRIFKENTKQSKEKLDKCESFFNDEVLEDDKIENLIEDCIALEKYRAELKNYDISWQSKNEIEKLKKVFENSDISEDVINNKISKCNNLNEIRSKFYVNEEKKSNLLQEKEELEKRRKVSKIFNLAILLISVALLGTGGFLYLTDIETNKLAFPLLIAGGIVLFVFILKFLLSSKSRKKYLNNEKELNLILNEQQTLRENGNYIQKDIESFIDDFSEDEFEPDPVMQLSEIKTKYIRYKDLKKDIMLTFEKQNEVTKRLEKIEKNIVQCLSKYFNKISDSYMAYAQEIQMKKSELNKQKADYEEKLKIQEDYKKANKIEEIDEKKQAKNKKEEKDIEALKKAIEEKMELLTKEINKLNDNKSYNRSQMDLLENRLDEISDIETEIGTLNSQIGEMIERCNILEKTKDYLERAKEQFSSHYLGGMQKNFMKNFEMINQKDMDIQLDVNLNVQINEQGSNKEIKYFSAGYRDLIYICMRLSLINSLFENEKPFIILDDPFVNLDKDKIQNAMKLIKNISKDYQIIYFICHESRK